MTNTPLKLNEQDLVTIFLSEQSIANALTKGCNSVRNTFPCPNERLCKDRFDSDSGCLIIKREREKFWKLGQKVRT